MATMTSSWRAGATPENLRDIARGLQSGLGLADGPGVFVSVEELREHEARILQALTAVVAAERESCAREALATGYQCADRMGRSHQRRMVRRFAGFIADAIRGQGEAS